MEDLPDNAFEQFVFYQKDLTIRKSRHTKKFQKIQKLKHDMNDPQMKKKRHQVRRAQQKAKLRRELDGLSEQQARKFLDQKKEKKRIAKEKILDAIKNGQQIYVDIVYEKKMNEKQNKSLAIQVELIMKSIRHLEAPPGVHLCSVGGVVEQQLQKMGYHFWPLESHKEDIVDLGKSANKKLVYLSPDAPQPLKKVQDDTAYIIGGLVDRSVKKDASWNRARQLGIQARHLPIRQFMKSRTCLNLDHVVMILCKFKQCNDWQKAFDFGAPKRWKRDEGEHGIRKIQKSDDDQQKQLSSQEENNSNEEKEEKERQSEEILFKQTNQVKLEGEK